jgi:sulfate transport system permease protein
MSSDVKSYMNVHMTEPRWVRALLIGITVAFLAVFLLVPLFAVFTEAFSKGWQTYARAVADPVALSAVRLTLLTT